MAKKLLQKCSNHSRLSVPVEGDKVNASETREGGCSDAENGGNKRRESWKTRWRSFHLELMENNWQLLVSFCWMHSNWNRNKPKIKIRFYSCELFVRETGTMYWTDEGEVQFSFRLSGGQHNAIGEDGNDDGKRRQAGQSVLVGRFYFHLLTSCCCRGNIIRSFLIYWLWSK